jgi:hypothetical protein
MPQRIISITPAVGAVAAGTVRADHRRHHVGEDARQRWHVAGVILRHLEVAPQMILAFVEVVEVAHGARR